MVRVVLERDRPLKVGDKLANRHGHKGVVGAILPDEEMPRWRGEPLQLLVDPVGVLNRSNWGQLFETIAGGILEAVDHPDELRSELLEADREALLDKARDVLGIDRERAGRSRLTGPEEGGWLPPEVEFLAVAGSQFVMRMPQNAEDALAASPRGKGPGRGRAQRFGEMDRWALWGHGVFDKGEEKTLGRGAKRFLRGLRAAGLSVEKRAEPRRLVIDRLPIDQEPEGEDWTDIKLSEDEQKIGEILERVDAAPDERPPRLILARPVAGLRVFAWNGERPEFLRWIPLLPTRDRRDFQDGRRHPLTILLRRLVRAALAFGVAKEEKREDAEARLLRLAGRWFRENYAAAVGASSESAKRSSLRRRVLGRRAPRSARAVIAPAGPLDLELDEVGVPVAVARALLNLPGAGADELRGALKGQTFWLKRDPVLHRYGLLRVHARLIDDEFVIRLPPSILGPLGADFDGDAVTMFARLPGDHNEDRLRAGSPSEIPRHDILNTPMFVPGKQYHHGLRLLETPEHDAARRGLNGELEEVDGPPFKTAGTWFREASERETVDPAWWRLVEAAALEALATDPGMGLGLYDVDQLADVAAVKSRASKLDVSSNQSREFQTLLLEGRGREVFAEGAMVEDPIATVMVPGRASVGRFGNVPRRLVHALRHGIDADALAEMARVASCLTERATQRALSVKAGEVPLKFSEFRPVVQYLTRSADTKPNDPGTHLGVPDGHIEKFRDEAAARGQDWRSWLTKPHKLRDILADGPLEIPLDDPRGAIFLEVE